MDARCHKLSPELQQPLLPCHGAPTSAKPLKLSIGRDGDGHSAASSSKSSTYAPAQGEKNGRHGLARAAAPRDALPLGC